MDLQFPHDSGLDPLTAPWPGVPHGFFCRIGGISRGSFASLNASYFVGDDPACVDENWRRVRASMPPVAAIARLNQVHGTEVRVLDGRYDGARITADGLAIATPGTLLTVLTADCVPVLMSAPGIVAALHAGWRGALAGICGEGVRAMGTLGASPATIRAALGPSIGACCFEVDRDLADRFADKMPGASRRTRSSRPGKAFIDLRGVVRDELERAGLTADAIVEVGGCTRCQSDRYFSRRAAGGAVTGLQLSCISLSARARR
jgi:purine-nucleoside/S-methyl-5'-thioadenosine phosphorylase / adenosine deaminase